MTDRLPRAILFDMDDTLISAYAQPELAWMAIAEEFRSTLHPLDPADVADAVSRASECFWADAERHRLGRLNLLDARAGIVSQAFEALARLGKREPRADLALQLAERYAAYRDEKMYLFDGAHTVVDGFRALGVKLALITNGSGPAQRRKIERFELEHRFDHIQIEGEHGFGKPEERAYRHAMAALGVEPHETWMVGDNLEWEIVAPQRLGIYAIWHDALGRGLPEASPVKPDRIIRSLIELLPSA
ncbi:MAG: HAD family hydrolase [Acetobacteraceae bacterium]